MSKFPGFPAEGVAFLRGLARNNEREWFQARKHIFDEKVKAPMVVLVEALNAELRDFAPQHIHEPGKAIYRIYRDTRFSSDKTPYKTHIAAIFPRKGREKHVSAGFYVAVSDKEVEVAGGLYMPGPAELIAWRSWLAEHHQEFRKAALGPVKLMGKLQGEALKRTPKGFAADHPAADLLKMKRWLYYIGLDRKLATTGQLLPEIVKRFRAMNQVVEMINAALPKVSKAKQSAAMIFD